MTSLQTPHIVIVGTAGGLELAFARHRARIPLIDQTLTHLGKPPLHGVAAGTLDSYEAPGGISG